MPDSKQLLIVKKVTALIESVNPDNTNPATEAPYPFDLRGAVFRGRATIGENDPAPACTILENPRPIPTEFLTGERKDHPKQEIMTLLVQGFSAQDDDNTGDPAYDMKAMVEQVLSRATQTNPKTGDPMFPDDFMLGKVNGKYLATDFTIQTGGVRPPTSGVSPTAFFYLPLVIKFTFNPTNPYV